MEKLHFTLNGLYALLMHNPELSMEKPGREKGLGRKTIPSPEEEAKRSRYLLPDGNMYVSAIAVRNSMLGGAKGYRIGKRAAADLLTGAVIPVDMQFPLLRDGKPISGDDYSVDTRRAVVKKQGIMRSRAKIELPWSLECTFDYNSELASLEHIKEALNNAGQIIGLLDYRPERKVGLPGWFGRFEVADIWSE